MVILCIALAAVFIKLGALAVWVSVLSAVVKVGLFVGGGFLLYFLWKGLQDRRRVLGCAYERRQG